jgi:hypothetical protein
MKQSTKILLGLIIFLAAILRLFNLSHIPPGVNRDEASIGFTAKSLSQTGRDEYGRFLPLSFESFGDWKLPLYIYSVIPLTNILGTTELAVRLPAALAGVLTVAAIFYLTRILFAAETVSLLAAFVLAISPWHMHISRVESEAIVAVLLMTGGTALFIKALRHKSLNYLIGAAVALGLTYFTYHGNHVSTTLLIIGLFGIYKSELFAIRKWFVAAGIGGLLFATILSATFSADHTKISGISIFGNPMVVYEKIETPRTSHPNPTDILARLEHNRATYAVVTILQNYLMSYGPEFLFIKGGGNSAHNIHGYGNMHAIESIFLLLGVVWLIGKLKNKEAKLILWWLALGGVAAAITKDAPHSNRMLAVIPALAICVALGITHLFTFFSKKITRISTLILIVAYAFSLLYYWDLYFIHFPREEAANWGYAYKKLTPTLFSTEHKDKHVIMTHPEASPYIYILFYGNYDAAAYQKEATRYPISRDGFTDVSGFGRFAFRPIDWGKDLATKNTLLITTPEETPSEVASKIIQTISLPDGKGAFVIVDTNR